MMSDVYEIFTLTNEEQAQLDRAFQDVMALADCAVPAVRAAARTAAAHLAQARNGQGIAYDLYTATWKA